MEHMQVGRMRRGLDRAAPRLAVPLLSVQGHAREQPRCATGSERHDGCRGRPWAPARACRRSSIGPGVVWHPWQRRRGAGQHPSHWVARWQRAPGARRPADNWAAAGPGQQLACRRCRGGQPRPAAAARSAPAARSRADSRPAPMPLPLQMNVERLQKMAGVVRTGGKGTVRR